MRLLLDTHTFLWFVSDAPQLTSRARAAIEDPANQRLLSAASHWEMAIKMSLGKLTLADPFHVFIPRELASNLIDVLPIDLRHSTQVATLDCNNNGVLDTCEIAGNDCNNNGVLDVCDAEQLPECTLPVRHCRLRLAIAGPEKIARIGLRSRRDNS